MKIEVTLADIKWGTRYNASNCAVAQALRRLFPDADITVAYDLVHIDDREYVVPPVIQEVIHAIDRGEHVEPFAFELELEEDSQ